MSQAFLTEALLRYGYPSRYGDGLAPMLSCATGHKYVLPSTGSVEREKK